jgi:hypothetical protein
MCVAQNFNFQTSPFFQLETRHSEVAHEVEIQVLLRPKNKVLTNTTNISNFVLWIIDFQIVVHTAPYAFCSSTIVQRALAATSHIETTNLEEERMFKNAKMFVDHGNGCFTTKELLSIRLLSLMQDIGAPLKMHGKIVSFFKDAITTTFRHHHPAIKHCLQRFGMNGLYPTILTQPSSINIQYYPVPVHNAQAMIKLLLSSSLAQDESNCFFPNPDNAMDPPPDEVTMIADIDTVRSYQNAYKTLCHRPNHVLRDIILYNKLATKRHGYLSLQPVCFSLSILNQKMHNHPEGWRPLGYVPNIGLAHTFYQKCGKGSALS